MNAVRQPADQALTTTTIAEYSPTAAALSDLRTMYADVVYDVTTGKGMDQAKKARATLRDLRVSLEKTRVEIKAPALERCRQIDSEAKRITAELSALEDPIDEQIKSEEQRKERERAAREEAERQRIAENHRRFEEIRTRPALAAGATVEQIDALLVDAEAVDPATFAEDMRDAASYERQLAINGLKAARDRREQQDKDAAELEQLRAERAAVDAERERLAQAERDRVEAAERAERERQEAERIAQAREQAAAEAEDRRVREAAEAEQRLQEQREQAERDQAAAVLRERERAEQARRDEEERQRIEQERREANRKHVGAINRKAADALIEHGITEIDAKAVIALIATGKVPAVSIAY
jgi:colicin import membrane protein